MISLKQREVVYVVTDWLTSVKVTKIWYIDANNLYGYAMMQKLPYKDFEYMTITVDEILKTPDDSDHGYYIVCDNN